MTKRLKIYFIGISVAIVTAISSQGMAQQNPFPQSASEVPTPVAGAVLHEQYVKTIGRMAYVWGWPMVNSFVSVL